MSFGVSPSDIIKLVEFSTRIYVAFKDANDNSEAQVKALIEEFSEFHTCLVELDELMKEYGKRLPFSNAGFKETLERCQKTLEPYSAHLVDNKKMTAKKAYYTVKYIGKEKEIDNLRKQITGHYSALQLRISFLQTRLHLEATKQTQRLLASVPFRSISVDGHMYTTSGLASNSRANPNALPAPSDASQVYREWLLCEQWLKAQNERVAAQDGTIVRPVSLGGTPVAAPLGDDRTVAALYHLQREVEDVMLIEENRVKRRAGEQRANLSPSDAIRQQVRTMPQVPSQRTFSVESYASDHSNADMSSSLATLRPTSISSPSTTPSGTPQIPYDELQCGPVEWGSTLSPQLRRSDSVSTVSASPTSFGTCLGSRIDVSGLGINTAETTPDDRLLRHVPSAASLASLALGESVLSWKELSRRVQVQRTSARGIQTRSCDVQWRYREDTGLSFRAVGRCDNHVWTVQHFPASGPFIPLTTTDPDGEVSLDFPRSSFGKLEKGYTDIKYTFADLAASKPLQTMLYSNNGQDRATLLFDRQIKEISSDKNRPECRARNIRLWEKIETRDEPDGSGQTEVIVLLVVFYTSALDEKKAHWVEEPHHVFQWLKESEYKDRSDKLKLVFSKEPGKWTGEKLFRIRKDSKGSSLIGDVEERSVDLGSSVFLQRSNTVTSISSSSAMSTASSKSNLFRHGRGANRAANLNRFGYGELEIKFQCKQDRRDFVEIWKEHVRPLGHADRR